MEYAHPKGYRIYLYTWLGLAALTSLAMGVSRLPVSKGLMAFLLTGISMAKVLLIATYFMHLRFERRKLVLITAVPLILALILWVLMVPDTMDTPRRLIIR